MQQTKTLTVSPSLSRAANEFISLSLDGRAMTHNTAVSKGQLAAVAVQLCLENDTIWDTSYVSAGVELTIHLDWELLII